MQTGTYEEDMVTLIQLEPPFLYTSKIFKVYTWKFEYFSDNTV